MDLENLKNNPEQIKMLISVLSALLPDASNDNTPEPKTKPTKRTSKKTRPNKFDGKKVKTTRGKAKSSGVNYFDSMPEKNAHKEDTAIDKKLCKYPPTARRKQINLVKVRCRSCGKNEKVSPTLLLDQDRYKCNTCSSSAG
jgi:hypothetical protein